MKKVVPSHTIIRFARWCRAVNKGVLQCVLIMLGCSQALANTNFEASNDKSQVSFAGQHVGMEFFGVFEKWQARLVLPPHNNPGITAVFELASAKTGDFTYDSTLPEGDWFDVGNHPLSEFKSSTVTLVENGYQVDGSLTIKGISQVQSFLLRKQQNKLVATFAIDRLAYQIGMESDPDAQWVGQQIQMNLSIHVP